MLTAATTGRLSGSRRALPALCAALACAGAAPEAASAGTYRVLACDLAPSGATRAWAPAGDSRKLAVGQTCQTGGDAKRGLTVGTVGSSIGAGEGAEWRFSAPAGTTLRSIDYRISGYRNRKQLEVTLAGDRASTGLAAKASGGETEESFGAGPGGGVQTLALNGSSYVRVQIRCGGQNGCGDGGKARIALHAASVEVEDGSAPTLNPTSGTLVTQATQAGSATIVFDAADNTGVRAARLSIDGAEAAQAAYPCDQTAAVPCASQSGRTLSIDTASLADGRHVARLTVVDAAGNETHWDRSITVRNRVPGASPAPGSPGSSSPGSASPAAGSTEFGGRGEFPAASAPAITGPRVAQVMLRANPRRLRNRQLIRFTGSVTASGAPVAGVLVSIQARAGRRWIAFKVARTTSRGTFAGRYRFRRTLRTTRYLFRAAVPAQQGLESGVGISRGVRATVLKAAARRRGGRARRRRG